MRIHKIIELASVARSVTDMHASTNHFTTNGSLGTLSMYISCSHTSTQGIVIACEMRNEQKITM